MMKIFNFFNPTVKLDSVKNIESIKAPKYKPLHGIESPVNNIEYILQRKATQFKKEGRMDLAIACLKKSNELMDISNFIYSEKDYLRYIKYLRLDGQNVLADREESSLYQKHPEFKDKRISNLRRINETIKHARSLKCDLVMITSINSCPVCKKYNHKIFSISGKNSKYPVIPATISEEGGPCKDHILGITMYIEEINSK